MAGLLDSTQITALGNSQETLKTEAAKAQAVLSALYDADPEHTATLHSAWRPLWKLHQALIEAIVEAERIFATNDNTYGEWKF